MLLREGLTYWTCTFLLLLPAFLEGRRLFEEEKEAVEKMTDDGLSEPSWIKGSRVKRENKVKPSLPDFSFQSSIYTTMYLLLGKRERDNEKERD